MSIPTLPNEAIVRLEKFVKAVCIGHVFAKKGSSQRQSNLNGELEEPLEADGVEIPAGTAYTIFGAPDKVKAGQSICTFHLEGRQLTLKKDRLVWKSYGGPVQSRLVV